MNVDRSVCRFANAISLSLVLGLCSLLKSLRYPGVHSQAHNDVLLADLSEKLATNY